ncbi:TolC family protein [Alistipes sp. ZOR0009]|uniref:TolC family protein n=1 Tax=Alistipes sp. ZOR0009 TaxID=1339253 RepID=UPI000645FB2E|nr:TolC family protein [Alistipes sp. ZOR0009]
MNLRKTSFSITAICSLLFISPCSFSQTERTLTLAEAYKLAIANSKLLKLSQAEVETAQTATKVVRTALSPSLEASLSASYIGNGTLMNRNFTNPQAISMPHFGNSFGMEASQVIFTGKAISSSIEKAKLEEKVAKLNYDRNELDICFLVTGYYLDLYKLKNQRKVFIKNVEQTEHLLQQVKSKEAQGMVLGNDITRHELQMQNLKLSLLEIENNRKIINNQLVATLGLPDNIQIEPDSSILEMDLSTVIKDNLLQQAAANLPELKAAAINKDIATKELQIAKSDYYPKVALAAANSFNGPILIEVPTINRNFNYWYVGIGIRYNLASLYKANRKVQLATSKQHLAAAAESIAQEQAQVSIYRAYTKFKESFEKLATYKTSSQLANENYRIVNNRYLSELVLITEMLDASNTKLNAELQVVNAKLDVIYCYYWLQREIGSKGDK